MCRGILTGMVTKTHDWQKDLSWIREVGEDGIILFENVANNNGVKQDALRAEGFRVVGGSAFGDRLENDRAYAHGILRSLGLPSAPVHEFDTATEASAFIQSRPARYVLKFNGDEFSAADNYVGQLPDGRDVVAMLGAKFRQIGTARASFVLMDYVSGIEMGIGAYFNGDRFLTPACLDWEHKRFFPGDLGELTGEMGTVVTYERTERFYQRTLAKLAPLLSRNRYCGYINLNTIVNETGIWPLEFTCRFGYPGYSILESLQKMSWSALLRAMVSRSGTNLETELGFAVGVVLTTRPFPYFRTNVPESVGLPIIFEGVLSNQDRKNIHFGEVAILDGELVTAGYHGWTMVVTGSGSSITQAQKAAYQLANRVIVPNLRFRNDIGSKLISTDYSRVEQLDLLDPL